MVKKLIISLIFLILLFPYVLLFKDLQFVSMDWQELGLAFKNTVLQSSVSAVIVIAFGFWGALGLNHLKSSNVSSRKLKFFEFLCLVPSFIPALFFVTALLQIVNPFPFGIFGIIIVHTLMYVGLCSLAIRTIFENKFYHLSEQAYLEGSSKSFFLKAVVKNMYKELFMIFLFLFIQFFTSFSVPLLVGLQSLTIETLIYEKIRIIGGLSSALYIGFIETAFIVVLLLFYKSKAGSLSSSTKNLFLMNSKSGLSVLVLPVLLFALGSLFGSAIGIEQLKAESFAHVFPLALKSISISLLTGLSLLGIMSLVTYVYKNKFLDKFLTGFIPLSTILIALSLLLVDFNLGVLEQDLKFVMAMTTLLLPALYRLRLKSKLEGLESQMDVAYLMGASDFFIFKKIIFPQALPTLLFLAGLGAFWTIGDFAISQIIYGKEVTLALYVQNLVGSYKLELANLYVIVLLFLGLLVLTMFREMKYVTRQKN